MFDPTLEVPVKRKKDFDRELCLVCQRKIEKPKRGPPPLINESTLTVFVEVCTNFASTKDLRYFQLQAEIRNKSASDLFRENYRFHTKCRSEFQKIHANQKRTLNQSRDKDKSSQTQLATIAQKVKRTETVSFNKELCLFCQENSSEEIFSVRQNSRDETLKHAFFQCPTSLALYKIRSSHAFDAMAGDIKYHNSCWREIIDKRIPEINVEPSNDISSSAVPCIENQQVEELQIEDFRSEQWENNSETAVQLRNGRILEKEADEQQRTYDGGLRDVLFSEIIEGLKIELLEGKVVTMNNLVKIYKSRLGEHNAADLRTDKAIRIDLQRYVTKNVCDKMDGVVLQKPFERNDSLRVIPEDAKAFAVKYAEENTRTFDEEVSILKKASMILRKRTLNFMKQNPSKCEDFSISPKENEHPPELSNFVYGFLFGQRKLESEKSIERKMISETIMSSIMDNIRTDKQVRYEAKRKTNARRRYHSKQSIALALSIRHCERNNVILRLLSAPNFGLIIPPRLALVFETMIANAMIKISQREGVYIPPNMQRGVRVSFHIDNFDELVITFDGKNTVHYLLIVCFQRRENETKSIELKLEKTTSLKLIENSLGEITPCEEPSIRQFRRTKGCVDVTPSTGFSKCRSSTIPVWKYLRSFEHLLVKDESATYNSCDLINTMLDVAQALSEDSSLSRTWTLDSLSLPSLGATNSLVVDMDLTLTNVFPLPFVAGPASSTSAVFTALDIAHKTSIIANTETQDIEDLQSDAPHEESVAAVDDASLPCSLQPPPSHKTIIVLDLDLYAKAYKLVHARANLRNRYVLCLGELHIVFAMIRAIGTFIDCSGIDDSWLSAEWFDSESLLRQVKDCSNMKRALATHEATFIAMQTFIIKETVSWYGESFSGSELFDIIESARNSAKPGSADQEKFREAWCRMKSILDTWDLENKVTAFVKAHQNNCLLQFFVKYCDMVTRLMTFIEATRSRNWQLHLDSLEDMIPDFASMDRINYRRLTPVYIADMKFLKTDDAATWKYFEEGNFCCLKNKIPYTAIGRDHCGEQENKVLKGRGGVSGQSSNSNSTNRYFLTAPVLSQIFAEMMNNGGHKRNETKYHHQFNKAYTSKQNKWVISLLRVFEKQKVSLSSNEKDGEFYNLVTGQVFSNKIYTDLIGAYGTGLSMVESFANERLKPESKVSIFAPLSKAKLKNCKTANKTMTVKYKDKVATLKEENLFISRIAMIRGSRDVDMKSHVGKYELTSVVHSLMRRDGTLIDGWDGKSDLATRILVEANVSVEPTVPFQSECVAIDAMYIMNQISTKPLWIKTGNDLAAEFCKRIDQQSGDASGVIVGFEWYTEDSLKISAWKSRASSGKSQKKVKRVDYNIEPDTDLSKRCMADILGTISTKKSLTKLLMNALVLHLRNRGVEFFVAGNGVTHSSHSGEGVTNHREGETSLIMGLCSMKLSDKRVVVCGNDVDLFTLLLGHYQEIDCLDLHMKSLKGFTPITPVYHFLGHPASSALLAFHAITGNDIAGKFSGKSKEFWTGRFLAERNNESFIDSLAQLHTCNIEEVRDEIARFICRSYCPKNTPKKITDNLVETRYFLYRKFSSETSKLPPSPGAFVQHLKRACIPLSVWKSANKNMTVTINPLEYGWEKKDEMLMPVCSADDVAPEGLVDLVTCNCKGDCTKGRCTCKKNNVACTDACGCGEACQNTDAPPPAGALNADDPDELFEHDCSEEELEELQNFLKEVEDDYCDESV